ncbi:hypothetical protein NL676_025655 [Syzygium grande]|nr:hypothetical protein NL676_025655 [Syzygium grande]
MRNFMELFRCNALKSPRRNPKRVFPVTSQAPNPSPSLLISHQKFSGGDDFGSSDAVGGANAGSFLCSNPLEGSILASPREANGSANDDAADKLRRAEETREVEEALETVGHVSWNL